MADLDTILADTDFRASSRKTQREILTAADRDFADATTATQDEILAQIAIPERPELTTAQKVVRSSAPSIIGGALGAAAGTVVAPGPGTLVGAAAGAATGEAVQQFLDPFQSGEATGSLFQIGAAGALPFVPAGVRRFFVSLPGAAAGLQEFLFKKLGAKGETLIAKFAPVPGTADQLFNEARVLGAQMRAVTGAIGGNAVPLTRTAQVAGEIAEEVATSKFATGASKAVATRAQAFASQNQVPFEEFRLNQSDVGALVRATERTGGAALGRVKQLYAAMWDDLESALAQQSKLGNPVGQKLTQAIDAFKREQAATFFKDAFEKSTLRRVGLKNLDVDTFMTKIDRMRDVLDRLMPKAEVDEALDVLKGFAKIPTMAKTPRLGFEQMPFAQRAVVGGAIGFFAGGAPGAAGGVLAVEAISSALTTRPGRTVVRTMMTQGATLDQIGNALLQTSRRAMVREQP